MLQALDDKKNGTDLVILDARGRDQYNGQVTSLHGTTARAASLPADGLLPIFNIPLHLFPCCNLQQPCVILMTIKEGKPQILRQHEASTDR